MWTHPRDTGTLARSAVRAILVGVVLATATSLPATPPAGPLPLWSTNFSGPGATSIDVRKTTSRHLADGSYMVAAASNTPNAGFDVTVARYDSAGNVLSTSSVVPATDSVLALDPFGALFVFGSAPQSAQLWLMKYDGVSGHPLWAAPATFRDPASTSNDAAALAIDGRGDVLVTGYVFNAAGNDDWITLKFDGRSGALLWGPARFDGAAHGNDFPIALALDGAGNVVVTGRTANGSDDDLATVKYSGATGAQLWSRVFAGPQYGDIPAAVTVDRAGNVIVFGSSTHPGGTTADFITLKYDGATGATLWGPSYFDGAAHLADNAVALTLDASGSVFVSGTSSNGSGIDIATVKYDGTTGALVWGPALLAAPGGGLGTPQVALAVDGAGNLLLTGQRRSGTVDYCTVKYDGRTGALLWGPSVFNAPSGGFVAPSVVFVDGAGDVLTTAFQASGSVTAAATLKYSGATGGTLWGPVLLTGVGGVGLLSSRPVMATDGSGNVVVTGVAGTGTSTFKLAAATGAILWGPVSLPSSSPGGLAVDGSGDVFVAYSKSNGTDGDALVLKYSGADGHVLWGPTTIDRGPGLSEYPLALNVDASGNVIVSGTTGPSPQRVFSAKCSGAAGAILWGPMVYGPDLNLGLQAYPQFFFQALDGAGSAVILTEPWSLGPPLPPFTVYTPDFSTLKINGTTGLLAWGPVVYQGTNGAVDLPSALAVNTAGDVFVAGASGANMALLKYSGGTGATLWGPVLHASGTGSSRIAMTLDGSGNVFLSGTSGSGIATNVETLKYDGAAGTVVWGPVVYDSTGYDQAHAVAVDSSGDVVVAASASNTSFLGLVLLKYSGTDGSLVWGPALTDFAGDSGVLYMRLVGNDPVLVTGNAFAARYTLSLGIQSPPDLPPALCGQSYTLALGAENGASPYAWTVVAGNPPLGISLDIFGVLSGTPTAEGTFAFRVRVTDNTTAFVERDFSLTVVDAGSWLPVVATVNPICSGSGTTLSVSGSFFSYLWLPGGETSSTITVSPAHPKLYGMVATDGSGCKARGTIRVEVGPVPVAAPTIATPPFAGSGSPNRVASISIPGGGGSYSWSITNGTITSGQGTSRITFTAGSPGPLTLQVVETTGAGCTSPMGSANVNVVGPQSALLFYTLPPCRILDTRNPNGPFGGPALVGSTQRVFTLTGTCGIPATAKSISANLTVTQPAAAGFLIAYPGDQSQPATSTINFRAGQTRANNAMLLLAIDGTGRVAIQNGSAETVHLILDVNGYFQ